MAGATAPTGRVRTVHWVRQVHGCGVVVVPTTTDQGGVSDGSPVRAVSWGDGDALVSAAGGVGLAVLTADCGSIALGSPEGVAGSVHAGWRGLMAGVVERAVEAMVGLGASEVVGALGPCIHPGCYEFSDEDLDRVAVRFGDQVRGRTRSGHPALDLPATVAAALGAAGAGQQAGVDVCTGCGGGYFSHRVRADGGRQGLVTWSSPGGEVR